MSIATACFLSCLAPILFPFLSLDGAHSLHFLAEMVLALASALDLQHCENGKYEWQGQGHTLYSPMVPSHRRIVLFSQTMMSFAILSSNLRWMISFPFLSSSPGF